MQEAVDAVLELDDQYVDADLACEALAACEIIACLKGNRAEPRSAPAGASDLVRAALASYTEDVDAWILAHPVKPPVDLVEKAARAIDRILAPESELAELWGESDEFEQWKESVADLRRRVTS